MEGEADIAIGGSRFGGLLVLEGSTQKTQVSFRGKKAVPDEMESKQKWWESTSTDVRPSFTRPSPRMLSLMRGRRVKYGDEHGLPCFGKKSQKNHHRLEAYLADREEANGNISDD